MFVASEPVALAFWDPFISRWVFDVEILARLVSEVTSTRASRFINIHSSSGMTQRAANKTKRLLGCFWDLAVFISPTIFHRWRPAICWNNLQAGYRFRDVLIGRRCFGGIQWQLTF